MLSPIPVIQSSFKGEFFKDTFNYQGNLTWLPSRTIFVTRHGSHAYGTNIETSDEDFKGIAIPPKEYFLGYLNNFEQAEFNNPDMVIYDIRKFFKLAADCNPNIIEVLHTDPKFWALETPEFKTIHNNRELFISKKARYTFGGYAFAQLKRISLHYRWLHSEIKAPPTREEFGLKVIPLLPKDQLMAAQAEIQKKIDSWEVDWKVFDVAERIHVQDNLSRMLAELGYTRNTVDNGAAKLLGFDDNFIHYLQLEREYKQKVSDWESYLNWKATRNPKRAELEAKYGYDAKHAYHLVRLLRCCKEILQTGQVIVKRPDREELLAIRNGAWTYEYLIEWAEKQDKELNELYKTSTIPKEPNRKKIDELLVNIVESYV
jgi:predicted nucleotidyltransferase